MISDFLKKSDIWAKSTIFQAPFEGRERGQEPTVPQKPPAGDL